MKPIFAVGDMIKVRDGLYPGISFFSQSKYLVLNIIELSSTKCYEVLNITNGEINNLSMLFVHNACEAINNG